MTHPKARIDWSRVYHLLLSANEADREEAVRKVYRTIFGVLRALVPDQERPDLCGEVWGRLWASLKEVRKPGAFGAFILTTVHRVVADWRRTRRRRPGDSAGDDPDAVEDLPANSPGHSSLPSDLHRALQRLTDQEREAVLLKRMARMTSEEAARELGIPLGTFKHRFGSGIAKLRKFLRDYRRPDGS